MKCGAWGSGVVLSHSFGIYPRKYNIYNFYQDECIAIKRGYNRILQLIQVDSSAILSAHRIHAVTIKIK